MRFRLPKTRGMLRGEAASWLARLQSGRDPNIQLKFRQWHDSDARHAAAFEAVRRSYEQAGLLRHSSRVTPQGLGLRPQPPARSSSRGYAVAAAIAVAVFVPAGVLLVAGVLPLSGTSAMVLATRVGEIRQFDLADGSRVTLDTATKVEVEIGRSRRSAHLAYGRARFQIVRAKAPFIIEAAGATVSAQHGVLDVQQVGQQGHIQVLAGTVALGGSPENGRSPLLIGAGEAVTFNKDAAGQESISAPGADWTTGMLQFNGTPLSEAVQLANRYSSEKIIVADDLKPVRVTGAYRAGDVAGLARSLAAAFHLSLERTASGDLLLRSQPPQPPEKKNGG